MTVELRKDLFADERDDDLNEIGKPTLRQDILGHVTGRSPFFDDHLFDGLLHVRCVRSPHHHARIRSIDVTQAERMPGVVRVIRRAHERDSLCDGRLPGPLRYSTSRISCSIAEPAPRLLPSRG